MMHMEQAPDAIQKLAAMLTERAGKLVNYLSLVGYENEKDHINWHQHSEDECRDARVFIVSLGETRTFGLRPVCAKGRLCGKGNEAVCNGGGCSCETCKGARKHRKTACKTCQDKSKWIFFQPVHGSLIEIPHEYNATHEHAVLDDKEPKSLRISFNTKHIPPEDIADGNGYIPKELRQQSAAKVEGKTEVVHCMRDAYDVYIGRKNGKAGLPESRFANRSKGDYEAYIQVKLRTEPSFAGEVLKLHGKRLGCWCKGTNRDFSKCHDHIVAKWADMIFDQWEGLKPDKAAMRQWLNQIAREAS